MNKTSLKWHRTDSMSIERPSEWPGSTPAHGVKERAEKVGGEGEKKKKSTSM